MIKFLNLILILLITFGSYSQNCGFEANESSVESKKKVRWFEKKMFKEEFVISNDKKNIPPNVLKQLDCFVNGFDIANPDEEYQDGCIVGEEVPSRHLILLAKNDCYLIISYNTYNLGISGHHIWIKYSEKGITDFWSGQTLGGFRADQKFDINNYIKKTAEFALEMN